VFFVQIDPRIRSAGVIEQQLELPVLGEIPQANEPKGLRKGDYSIIAGALVGVVLLYVVFIIVHSGGAQLAELLGGLTNGR